MDGTIHHDPYLPEVIDMPTIGPHFRQDRWVRAGATDEQLLELAERHARLTVDQQHHEGRRVDGLSDGDLAMELTPPAEGKVQDVLDQVGSDVLAARSALAAEQAKSNPRVTLVAGLQAVIENAVATADVVEPDAE